MDIYLIAIWTSFDIWHAMKASVEEDSFDRPGKYYFAISIYYINNIYIISQFLL